jgi:hypothetical protein
MKYVILYSVEIMRDYPVNFIEALWNQMTGNKKLAKRLITKLLLTSEVL